MDRRGANVGPTRDIDPEGIGPERSPRLFENSTCIMAPMKAAARQAFRTEYRFRDRGLTVSRGSPLPLGAVATPNGINFVLLCRHGTAVWLVLSEPCDGEIHAEIPLDPL